MTVSDVVAAVLIAPCAGCEVTRQVRLLASKGAVAQARTVQKSPAVRALRVHTCGRGE